LHRASSFLAVMAVGIGVLRRLVAIASYWIATLVGTEGKHVLVLGGIMKSHHISFVPIVEELCNRGHEVTFALPNISEAREWFPKGVASAKLVYWGTDDWSVSGMKIPDMKQIPWWKQPLVWGDAIWNYRDMVDKPFFAMLDDFRQFARTTTFDAALTSSISMGLNQALKGMDVPFVNFLGLPAIPVMHMAYSEEMCRYPTMTTMMSVDDLRSSFAKRLKNQMTCQFLSVYEPISMHEINAVFAGHGFKPANGWIEILQPAPVVVSLGGPPISFPFKAPPSLHIVGTVERSKPRNIESVLLDWLEAPGGPVVCVSMGTKYELTNETCKQFVSKAQEMVYDYGVRVLWSLRASQQKALQHLLPKSYASLRIEEFTPQPEVLNHRAVMAFVSHCGWGGVTDALAAGVPILAYPSFSDQNQNAARLIDLGAALLVEPDFSNLIVATHGVLGDPSFAQRAKDAGEALQRYGGLKRLVDIFEVVADGGQPVPDAASTAAMADIDPFFLTPQTLEASVAKAIWISIGLLLMGLLWLLGRCCCRCCCCCCPCCRSKSAAKGTSASKKKD